jgi:hypothetical protein
MPKIEVDYETLDGIVAAALKDMLAMMTKGYDEAQHEVDREGYDKDIAALRRVLRIYE